MVDNPVVKTFKGLVGDILNLDTGATFRQPHGNGRDTEVVTYVTDDPNHFCKDCKTGVCKNCGREMNKRDLELGQDMSRKDRDSARNEVIGGMTPSEYEEFTTGRYEPLDKLPWFRKCKDSASCEAYKNSNLQKNSHKIFSSRDYVYYDSKSTNVFPYVKGRGDPRPVPDQCERCGGLIKNQPTVKNSHPYWGKVCNDCADELKDSDI